MVVRKLSTTRGILLFEGADKAAYWRRFAMLLTLSVVIATMGLLRNSGAVVIAAMLVAPLMTPILGVAAAMVMGWLKRAVDAGAHGLSGRHCLRYDGMASGLYR